MKWMLPPAGRCPCCWLPENSHLQILLLCFTRHQETHILGTSWLDYPPFVSWHRLSCQSPVHHTQPPQHLQVPPSRAAPTLLGTSSTRTLSFPFAICPSLVHRAMLKCSLGMIKLERFRIPSRQFIQQICIVSCHVPGPVPGFGDITMNRTGTKPCLYRANISMGDTDNK